jgi:hypothetical protein
MSRHFATSLAQGAGAAFNCWDAGDVGVHACGSQGQQRDYPKGMQMCHMCKFYIAGGGRAKLKRVVEDL